MAKIEKWIVDRVLDAARIEDVIGDFVTLRKAGVNMTGLCPFHDDRTDGNFIVRPSTISAQNHGNTYRCFVCDAKGDAVKFLMERAGLTFPDAIRWLGRKYNIEVDDVPMNYTPPPPRPVPPPPPLMEIPRDWVSGSMKQTQGNVFINWLWSLPWSDEQRNRLNITLWQYCVGGWHDGRVVFWQIDHKGIPRAAKLMRYRTDGHRDKDEHPGWIYNQDGCRQLLNPDAHTIIKPLFGSHLLKRYPKAKINLVESEKTALVMANFYGMPEDQLWLACGGLQQMKLESMQPLIDQVRTVWLWPDNDGQKKWQDLADKLGSDNIHVYTSFFDTCWVPEDGDKADCADIIIRMMQHHDWKPRQESAPQRKAQPMPLKTEVYQDVFKDEPFLDQIELIDPRVRKWRDILRKAYPGKKHRPTPLTTNIEGVETVGEILKDHPLLNQLIENDWGTNTD